MTYAIPCANHTAPNGDSGLVRLDGEIEPKVFRFVESTNGMEYAMRQDFDAMGWNARTYWSILDPKRFRIA